VGRFTPKSEAEQDLIEDWEEAHDMPLPKETRPYDGTLPVVLVDFETRSYLDVRKTGAWRYAEDPTTEVLCMGYKIGKQPTGLWVPGINDFPQDLIKLADAGAMFEAHNVQFERAIWTFILDRQMGIKRPGRWKDTLAVCAYRGIPLSLDKAGQALNLPITKSERGKYLIQTLCTPKWGTKKEPDRIYREDWDLMQELYDYCEQDVEAEYLLSQTLGDLPAGEYGLWCLDQRINQRGVMLDMPAVESAFNFIEKVTGDLTERLQEITEGQVKTATQRDKMMKWFAENNLPLPNLQKETIEDLLTEADRGNLDYLDKKVIEAVRIRAELSKASTAKLTKMKETVSGDDRVRGLLQYHGAGTGRWAGRLVQPQNFPRPVEKNAMNAKGKGYLDMERLIADIKEGDPVEMGLTYTNGMAAVASSLRGMFIAAPDHELFVCDFSAIEARVTFWMAGCQTGIDVFHKSDAGESEDIYCVTASDLVGFEVTKANSHERQLGKITVLGCGYQMGWSKLQHQADKDYKTVLSDQEATDMVELYRSKYKEVKWLWYGLQDAAIETVRTGEMHSYQRVTFAMVHDAAGHWLTAILPNGRRLWYFDPVIIKSETSWGEMRDGVTYMGRDNKKGGSWGRIRTYGGMLTENVVQAVARDLMAEAMIRVEKAGYPVVLTVHDEIISELLKGKGNQEEFEGLMAQAPHWAEGCPIAVEGGVITRYQKI
jgi:DNA polymerase